MKVEDIMTPDPGCCGLEDTLSKAAAIMWEKDCGVVPVIDSSGRVRGVVTDRDICIAAALKGRNPSEICAAELMGRRAVTCRPGDKLKEALKKMRRQKIKRLPVVDREKRILGMVSLSDFVRAAGKRKKLRKPIWSALEAIYHPHPIVLHEILDEIEN